MCLQFGFVIFWQKDFGTKAAHKMLAMSVLNEIVLPSCSKPECANLKKDLWHKKIPTFPSYLPWSPWGTRHYVALPKMTKVNKRRGLNH
jgi:hypothetical protein